MSLPGSEPSSPSSSLACPLGLHFLFFSLHKAVKKGSKFSCCDHASLRPTLGLFHLFKKLVLNLFSPLIKIGVKTYIQI